MIRTKHQTTIGNSSGVEVGVDPPFQRADYSVTTGKEQCISIPHYFLRKGVDLEGVG
jgi:hypothetical protein